ncbi:type I-E CRISPR-associated protein Cse1/CasA [Yinghuangia sp. ASG 101]|uniref:type I-E CRISPR-associated protein Cse1/CasA n=1 Tax=Yinghuangia sp. ASG 101 TaxID=2896848 RepID=UPI001E3A7DEF|nr:type I-E CRISPR-associated protein Cse1/CasA [Yinghuangia sp. ASG 101]UGQ10908.1 type I-E CRISPR-associated protein Cse1/CasA [Yinghuangia sp. ASG 101]
MPSFNLVDEPWLRADSYSPPEAGSEGQTSVQGRPERSLRELLLDAHRFVGISVETPTMVPAVLRQVLLPVVVDALGRPKDAADWRRRFRQGQFGSEEQDRLNAYLDEHRHRFDLFDPAVPFGQVADLHTAKGETKGAALLVATAATGNNVPLFACRSEGDTLALTPAEASRWLVHAQCWDTAAIKTGVVGDPKAKAGKTTGNPTGPLGQLGVVVPMGRTLYETLLLNIPLRAGNTPGDKPQWRRDAHGPGWDQRRAAGLLDLWTWQSRRIRLFPEETADGVRVTRVLIAAGDRLSEVPECEPHTTWTLPAAGKSKGGAAPVLRRARRHQPGKAAWRGLEALLAIDLASFDPTSKKDGFATTLLLDQLRGFLDLPHDYPLQLDLTGIAYGNQSAVVDDIIHDAIPLPLLALPADSEVHATLLAVADQAEQLARAVNNLSADLRRAAGAEPIPWDQGHRPGELVLHALDPVVRRLLVGVRDAGDDEDLLERGCLAWEQLAWRKTRQVAEHVIRTAAPSTFAGRKVQQGGKELTYRLGTAETNFRRRLREILPRAAGARTASS